LPTSSFYGPLIRREPRRSPPPLRFSWSSCDSGSGRCIATSSSLTIAASPRHTADRSPQLKFLVSHFHSLSTVVSIFIGLSNHAFLHGIPPCPTPGVGCSDGIALQSAYQVLTVASLGLFTVALVVALICATMGWRLALCGPPGSMHQAVEALHQFRGQTSLALGAALLATFAAAAIHPLMLLHHSDLAHRPPRVVATASSASCAASAVVTWLGARSAIAHFRLPGEMRTRGYFTFGRRHQLAESRSRGATPGSGTPLRRWLARLARRASLGRRW